MPTPIKNVAGYVCGTLFNRLEAVQAINVINVIYHNVNNKVRFLDQELSLIPYHY